VAWIKSHQELRNHPKVKRLARICSVPPTQVIGHLHFLWWYALDYAQDGDLSSFDNDELAEIAGWEGEASTFVEAMGSVGFLDGSPGEYSIHDWGEYAGRLIEDREKKRENDRVRAQAYRERQKEKRHTNVTRDVSVSHASVTLPEESREEETRVEESRADSGGDAATLSLSNPSGQKPVKHARGEYGWVKLSDVELNRLIDDYGDAAVKRGIQIVDERAQQTGNKNKWKDWNLTVRRAIREGWGGPMSAEPPPRKQQYGITI